MFLAGKNLNLHSAGEHCFPFKFDPFPKGDQNNFDRTVSPEHVSIPL